MAHLSKLRVDFFQIKRLKNGTSRLVINIRPVSL